MFHEQKGKEVFSLHAYGRKNKIEMTSGPILSAIVRFFIPLMISNLLQACFNAADMMIVGFSGEGDAVGAVGTTSPMTHLILNIFVGLSVGANVVVARSLGAKDEQATEDAVHTAVGMSLIFGLVGGVVGILLSRTVLTAMGTEGKLLELALSYIYLYFAGLPFIALSNYLSAVFRAKGDTRTPLVVYTAAGVINVLLNAFFVFVVGWSVEGVALATLLVNVFSGVVLLVILMRDEGPCRFALRKLRLRGKAFRDVLAVGLPAGLQNALFSLSNMLIQSSILDVNNALTPAGAAYAPVVKGNSAAASLENFAFTSANAVHQAAVTFTGQNVGAKKYDRVKRVLLWCFAVEIGVSVVVSGLMLLFRDPLLALYKVTAIEGDTLAMLAYDTAITRTLCKWAFFFTYGFMDVGTAVMRGFGKSTTATVLTLIGTCLFRVVWIFTVFRALFSLEVIYLSYPLSWFLTGVASLVGVVIVLRKRLRTQKSADEQTAV